LPVFTSLLVDIAYKTQGRVHDCAMVLSASNKYRGSQDYMGKFFDDNIVKEEGIEITLKWRDVWHDFREWYTNNGYGRDVPKHSEVKNFMENRLGLYPKRGWKNYRMVNADEMQ
jgi:phage/plasmid-associated DNA primase